MKKVLALIAIVAFVSCKSGETTVPNVDSSAKALVDTAAKLVDSAATMIADSAAAAMPAAPATK